MTWATPLAYGLLRLTPTEFRRLTVTEFQAMVEGRTTILHERDKRWRWFMATMTANLMNATGHMDTAVKATDLLGADEQAEALAEQARLLAEQKSHQKKRGRA